MQYALTWKAPNNKFCHSNGNENQSKTGMKSQFSKKNRIQDPKSPILTSLALVTATT